MGKNTHGAKHRRRKEEAQAAAAAAAEEKLAGPGQTPDEDELPQVNEAQEADIDDEALAEAHRAAGVPADVDDITAEREQRRLQKKAKRNERRAAEAAEKEAAVKEGRPVPLTPKEQRRVDRQQQQAAREAAKQARLDARLAREAAGPEQRDAAPTKTHAAAVPATAPASAAPPQPDANDLSLTIFVAGLPFESVRDIAGVFTAHGAVAHVSRLLRPDTGEFSGMALMRLADDASFHACLALNGLALDDASAVTLSVKRAKSKPAAEAIATHVKEDMPTVGEEQHKLQVAAVKHAAPLQVDAQSRVVYVGNLHFDVDEDSLRGAFPDLPIEAITWGLADPADPSTFRGYAHVRFATHSDAQRATELNGSDVLGRPMRIAFEVPRRKPREEEHRQGDAVPTPPESATRAYVTGLAYDVDTNAATAALMAVLPGAQRVKLGFDAATGAFRGYAHIEFTTPEQLAAVVKVGSASVLGRTVKVTYSKEKARIAGNASGPKKARKR